MTTELECLIFQAVSELDAHREAWPAADTIREVLTVHRECLPDPCPTIKAISQQLLGMQP